MSISNVYTYPRWEDGPDEDLTFDYADNNPETPVEALSVVSGVGWWSAAPRLEDLD